MSTAALAAAECSCGSGKRPTGFCQECGKYYCSECSFTHLYTPPPMNTPDSIHNNLKRAEQSSK